MDKKLKIGILGAGGRANFQINAIIGSGIAEPVIVFSPFEDEGKNFSEKYRIRYTTRWQDIIEDPEIDGITISTPNATHYQFSLSGLENNKNVLVEYPPTLSIEEIDRLIEIARNKNLVYWVSLTQRLENPHNTIKNLLTDTDEVLFTFHSYISSGLGGWYSHPDVCGSLFAAQHFHFIDQLTEIFGDVKRVSAHKNYQCDQEGRYTSTYSTLTMKFKNNTISHIEFAMGIKDLKSDFMVRFVARDKIFYYSKGKLILKTKKAESEIEMKEGKLEEDTQNYLKAILEKKCNTEKAIKARKTLQIALYAEKSASENRVVELE